MKYVIYAAAFLLLISEPAPDSNAQIKRAVIQPIRALLSNKEKKVLKPNLDTVNNNLKEGIQLVKSMETKPVIKYRWRTKIVEVHDTVYLDAVPVMDTAFIPDPCPVETVYVEKPVIKKKKKGFFKRIF